MSETTTEHESVEEPAVNKTPSATSDEQLVAMLVDRARSEGLQLTALCQEWSEAKSAKPTPEGRS